MMATKELFAGLGTHGFLVVDLRGTAAYNGWQTAGEARGRHIPGAVSLPASWVRGTSGTDIGLLLESKGIQPDETIVLHGASEQDWLRIARLLRDVGCRDLHTYEAGMEEWAADDALSMARLPNYEKLVHP